jgi:hypothetical protein
MHACIQRPPFSEREGGRERWEGRLCDDRYHVVEVHERVVDGDDLDIGVVCGGAQHNAANAAKAKKRNERTKRAMSVSFSAVFFSLFFVRVSSCAGALAMPNRKGRDNRLKWQRKRAELGGNFH